MKDFRFAELGILDLKKSYNHSEPSLVGRTNFAPAQTTEPPGHKLLVVNVPVVCPVEEEEEGIGITSGVKVEGEDPETLFLKGAKGDGPPWLAVEETSGVTIPLYRFNQTMPD